MREKLQEILVCPSCMSAFSLRVFKEDDDKEIIEGLLLCKCGNVYPIINNIPRILQNGIGHLEEFKKRNKRALEKEGISLGSGASVASRVSYHQEGTQRSFGYQWTKFRAMDARFEEDTLTYLHPLTSDFFNGRFGLDVGCGIGRHMYYVAQFGAEMVGVDFSEAIDSANINLKGLPNVDLVQADIYNLPFKEEAFDFAYSIGVLHHLPDPQRGFMSLLSTVKRKGCVSIWVYSKSRFVLNNIIEAIRFVTTRLPLRIIEKLSFIFATMDCVFFIVPYRYSKKVPVLGWLVDHIAPFSSRTESYSESSFYICYTDWFDRLSAPIRYYYSEEDLKRWAESSELNSVHISSTGDYGWRLCGKKD